ncbi:MAG: glycosyltransferase family 4 protein [Chitinophagaceae bacterium]|nr:glycosyltransferase family 4 protein [Chitinophagaceae bacterium]
MTNKSILIVTSEFPPLPGGIGNHAYNLAVYLVKHGYKVRVLTNYRADSEEQYQQFLAENKTLEITMVPRLGSAFATYHARLQAYRRLLKEESSDVVFSGKFSVWLAALGLHKKKAWAIIHGSEIQQQGLKRWWFNRGLLTMDALISVSSFTEALLIKSYPHLSKFPHVVINNGFSLTQHGLASAERPHPQAETCRIITVGGMHPRKGQHNIISALPTINQYFREVEYIIAGLPNTMPALQALAKELKVEHQVRFVVSPETPELIELLQQAHVFAMLSETMPNGDIEGFGIAILEGMSLGLPAIGSANSGIRDAINNGHSGYLVNDIHNPDEIATVLKAIMMDYTRFSNAAQTWSARFTWEKVILQYLHLFESTS